MQATRCLPGTRELYWWRKLRMVVRVVSQWNTLVRVSRPRYDWEVPESDVVDFLDRLWASCKAHSSEACFATIADALNRGIKCP